MDIETEEMLSTMTSLGQLRSCGMVLVLLCFILAMVFYAVQMQSRHILYPHHDHIIYGTARHTSTFRLATFIADHMVLQREPHKSRIWGFSSSKGGTNMTVRMDRNPEILAFAVADENGSWMLELPPQAAGAGHTLEVSDGETNLTLTDIAFGDVFLCSGQSNMEFTVGSSFNASQDIQDSIHYPNLRLATVNRSLAPSPVENAASKASYIWARSSPEALNEEDPSGGQWGVFSAVCYFFGRELYKSMDGKVPIGLVASSWGGQRIEFFSSQQALNDKTCGGTRPPPHTEALNKSEVGNDNTAPPEKLSRFRQGDEPVLVGADTQIWNAMIHPLKSMRFTGAIWYQGEANARDASTYACRFPAMIDDWRRQFELPDLAFVYVELAALRIDSHHRTSFWPYIRAAQASALKLPGVGMATAIDLGDPNSPWGSIHSRRKQEVGRRVALTMQALHYQDTVAATTFTGPVHEGVSLGIDSAHSTATVSFQPKTAGHLHLAGTAACLKCCQEPPYEVLTVDRSWKRVSSAQVRNNDQVVLITNEPQIFGVRYAWQGRPECALYNGYGGPDDHAGIPAAPFEWCAYNSGKGTWTHDVCLIPINTENNGEVAIQDKEANLDDSTRTRQVSTLDPLPTELRLSTFVDSHMVLQRAPHKARIWGWASPESSILATLVDVDIRVTTMADLKSGRWTIDLPPQPASDNHTIHITDGNKSIVLEDIAFGDVFLCSGQSNMEFTVPLSFNGTDEVADSINYPNLRIATVAKATSDVEMEDVPSGSYYNWARSSPHSITGNSSFTSSSPQNDDPLQFTPPVFSATCYFFGRELYKSMGGSVPIGLIVSSWGGQRVETFSSVDAIHDETCGGTVSGDDDASAVVADLNKDGPQSTQLWNAMIHPLLPMRFAGAVWYQGEANSDNATLYACRFPAMITNWRLKFNLPNLTFLYVELAGFSQGSSWPWVRSAQAAALSLPHVGRATAIDLGDVPEDPYNEIHPRRKQEVGRRLALTMRGIHYHEQGDLEWEGPIWKGVQLFFNATTNDTRRIQVNFQVGTAYGLHLKGSADCTKCCQGEPPIQLLVKSGEWIRADEVSLTRNTNNSPLLTVSIPPGHKVILGVRYAWEARPECLLYNHVNLPAEPWEWCAYSTGQPHWTNRSCALERGEADRRGHNASKNKPLEEFLLERRSNRHKTATASK